MGDLFQELKRRKVFRVAAVYAIVAWLIVQVAGEILPTFNAPQWVNQTIILILILGLPLALVLAWAYEVTPSGVQVDSGSQTASQVPTPQNQYLMYATFILVLLVAGFQLADRLVSNQISDTFAERMLNEASNVGSVIRSSINLEHTYSRHPAWGIAIELDVSKDGSQLVYELYNEDTSSELYVRDLASQRTSLITTNLVTPVISPDGTRIAGAVSGGGIEIVSISGGIARAIPLDWRDSGAAWLSTDEILYSNRHDSGIHRKSLTKVTDEALTEASTSQTLHLTPAPLPGKDAFLYVSASNNFSNLSDIYLYELDVAESKLLIQGGYMPKYAASGHITFIRSGDLWAVPFNLDSLEITGPEVRAIEGLESFPWIYYAMYAFSDDGRLIYLPGSEYVPISFGFNWIDRQGNKEDIVLPAGSYADPELSPDDQLLAVTLLETNGSSDIWVYDLVRETFGRRTFSGNARNPKWSPDGLKLAYESIGQGIWQINADGTGQPEQITAESDARPDSYAGIEDSLFYLAGEIGNAELKVLTYSDGAWISTVLFSSEYNYFGSSLSPDGRWLAYTSNETGMTEVYVVPYPEIDSGKWLVSSQGGLEPKWNANGTELFFRTPANSLASVEIDTENGFSVGTPQHVQTGFQNLFRNPPSYAVASDGERFIQFRTNDATALNEDTERITLTLVENWFEELSELAPPANK